MATALELEVSPLPTHDFPAGPDLNDPAALAKECEAAALGLDRQKMAAENGTLMGGHPSPGFFYSQTANVLRAAAVKLRASVPPAPTPASGTTGATETATTTPATDAKDGKGKK